ncbi:MAG TPA: OsmC family protein [Bacteroidia bacterium]|nr:OsmC family protein [Bacteroidia bacterium]
MSQFLENNLVVSIQQNHYQTSVKSRKHTFSVDEPEHLGGSDSAASPKEYLLAALGSCTAITLRMYADRKQWNVETINVELNLEQDAETSETKITRIISITGNITEEEKQRLLTIANVCPVHKILSNPIKINTSII